MLSTPISLVHPRPCPSLSALSVLARPYPSLSVLALPCPSLSVLARPYSSLPFLARPCSSWHFLIRPCSSLSVIIRPCPSLSVLTRPFLSFAWLTCTVLRGGGYCKAIPFSLSYSLSVLFVKGIEVGFCMFRGLCATSMVQSIRRE